MTPSLDSGWLAVFSQAAGLQADAGQHWPGTPGTVHDHAPAVNEWRILSCPD
jgi:hypothetical protein